MATTKSKPKPAKAKPAPEPTPEVVEAPEPTQEVAPVEKVTATCPMCGEEYESYGAVLCSPKCNRRARRLFPSSEVAIDELPTALVEWHEQQAATEKTTD